MIIINEIYQAVQQESNPRLHNPQSNTFAQRHEGEVKVSASTRMQETKESLLYLATVVMLSWLPNDDM